MNSMNMNSLINSFSCAQIFHSSLIVPDMNSCCELVVHIQGGTKINLFIVVITFYCQP